MKKYSKIALAIGLGALCFAANAKTELNVWEDIQKSKGIAQAVKDFEAQYDVDVKIHEMPYTLSKLRNYV